MSASASYPRSAGLLQGTVGGEPTSVQPTASGV
jgi:hypothetical protein